MAIEEITKLVGNLLQVKFSALWQKEQSLFPIDIVASKAPVRSVIEAAKKALYTGHIGGGKIFVYDVENVVKVRTGEEGYDALQDVE